MILTKDDLDREWQWLFLRCKNTAAAKAEILTLFSDEPDDEREWSEQNNLTNHITHKPGVVCEVDWSGKTMRLHATDEDKVYPVYLFVATLPYSQLAYVEPCMNMNEQSWINCNIHMFEYFGGVTLRIVCDNLKTGVISHPREGDIILNQCYEDFSNHYCTAIMPAGVKKPKHKPSVEGTVGKIATAIIARLRNNVYTSICDLKADVAAALEDFNNKPFQKREGSRREIFEASERITLRPLPAFPYEYAVWEYGRVIGADFHINPHAGAAPAQIEMKTEAAKFPVFCYTVLEGRHTTKHGRVSCSQLYVCKTVY